MNPITAWKLYRKVNQLAGQFQAATASYERTKDVSKSLFLSKTFWVNVFSTTLELAQMVSGIHVVPPGVISGIVNVANIGLRIATDQPVHIITPLK